MSALYLCLLLSLRTARRINCNDYVQNLYEYHDFDFDVRNKVLVGNYEKVKETIPSAYYYDFDEGYNLRFTRYGSRKKNLVKKSYPENNIQRRLSPKASPASHKTINYEPIVQRKPAPVMIKVNVGDKVRHKAYGVGKIYAIEGRYIRIHFENVGDKTFLNPDAFDKGYLQQEKKTSLE